MGAFSQSASAELSGDIRIGAIVPISGDLATYGVQHNLAQQIAIDDFNAYLAEKDAGWSFLLVSEDSQTLPTVAFEKIQSLRAKGILHVIGPETSGSLQSVKGYVDSNNMLVISCCSTSPLLAIGEDSIFRLAPDDTNQAVAIVELLKMNGIDVLVPVWREDSWGVGLKDALNESFPAIGGTVDAGFGYNPEASDFSSEASVLAEIVQGYVDENGVGNVGVAYIGFEEGASFFQSAQAHDILSTVGWFGTDATAKSQKIVDDPLALEFATNVNFTSVVVASGLNDLSTHVDKSVEAVLGTTPTSYASASYDAVWLLGLAMEETQSTDVDVLTDAIPQVAAERTGALGSLSLNDAGDLAQANYDIWAIANEEWTFLGTYDADSNSIVPAAMDAMEEKLSGEIEIGSIIPLTGKLARSGEENKIGYELAVDHFNQYLADKDAGWSLSVVSEYSQTKSTVTLEKVQVLNAKGIQHVIGPQSSGNIQSIKGYVDSNNMMIISPSSTSPLLAIGGDSIFRLAPDDSNQAVALVRLLQDAGIDVIVPIWRDEAWGVGLERAIRDAFSAVGGTVHEGIPYNPEASDFSSEASVLAEIVQGYVDEHGADKVGVASFGFGETQILFQSAASHDILDDVKWFGADAVTKDTVIIDDPITLEFATTTEFTTLQVASGKNDISKQVEEAVEEAIGRTPKTYASSAYDAIWLLGLSMERIQSTDVTQLTAVFPEVAAEHMGALGSTKLNEYGDLAQVNYDVWTVSDGQWKQLGVYFTLTDSVELAMEEKPVEPVEPDGTGGCLIATAAYGSELAPQVQLLREIRDNALLSTASGTSFMTGFNQVYYSFSPAIADLERENPLFRDAVLALITPGLYTMNIMTFADPGSEVSILVFGMLSIAAIGGVYVAGPILAVHTVRKRISRRN